MVLKAQNMTIQCNHLLKLKDLKFFLGYSQDLLNKVELYMKSAIYYLTNTLGISKLC